MRITYIPLVITLALSLVQANVASDSLPRGVAPSRAKLYTPESKNQWTCLDGSKSIPFSAVNDDYCDCPDGSDEPGTSACGTGYFYCQNKGHKPVYIITSRVNDGVCDPECCDGSDEYDGRTRCPNNCEQVGAASRKERELLDKIHKEGYKIRKEYAAYGQNLKKRLQEQLDKLRASSAKIAKDAADSKAALDAAHAKLKEYLESTRLEREAARELQLAPLIEQQIKRLAHATDVRTLFRKTLDELKENHNKNYHDLAVKSAISGYDEYLKELKRIADDDIIDSDNQRSEEDEEDEEKKEETEKKDEAENTDKREENDKEKSNQEKKNRTALQRMYAAQDETYDVKKDIGLMFQLLKEMKEKHNVEYNDEAVLKAIKMLDDFAPTWEDSANEFVGETPIEIPDEDLSEKKPEVQHEDNGLLGNIRDKLQKGANSIGLGFLFKGSKAKKSELELAQDEYIKASEAERKSLKEIKKLEKKADTDYGPDEAFAKLVDQCFEFKDHEYTYSVCMFGEAKQISNSDTSLGTFSGWEGDNYDTQLYTGGARCWNGPERSVKITMACGSENKILAVSEPSKCEYLYKMETPALCVEFVESDHTSDVHEAEYPSSPKIRHDEL
ncbi:hypothetical protein FBU30_007037 [Linnemannia zychae]|nr:hypothetical protein FBU30_007037 [Linnemannia zychae]